MPTRGLRPRRSVLYMPAANARALEKAKSIPADALIFDLEDAVAPDAKAEARGQAAAAVASGDYGSREVTIRCNGLDTPWGADDLAAAAEAGPAAVVIPKVDSTAYLADVARALDAGGAPEHTKIWAMIETPTGIFDARQIAACRAGPGLDHGDQRSGQGTPSGPDPRPRSAPAPSVHRDPGRPGSRQESSLMVSTTTSRTRRASRRNAYREPNSDSTARPSSTPARSRWPTQSGHPPRDEVEQARKIIAAFAEAEADGRGVVTVDGRMIENLHVDEARRVLAVADAIASI